MLTKTIAEDIYIPEPIAQRCHSTDIPEKLCGLSRLNVFIGPNNAGKSRLLRSLFAAPSLEFLPFSGVKDTYVVRANRFLRCLATLFKENELRRREALNKLRESIISRQLRLSSWHANPVVNRPAERNIPPLPDRNDVMPSAFWQNNKELREDYEGYVRLDRQFSELTDSLPKTPADQIQRIYIPAVRGVRSLTSPPDDLIDPYRDLAMRDYGWPEKLQLQIFTGQLMYGNVRSRLLGTLRERTQIRQFERFLGDTFFGGASVTLIPHERKKTLYVKVGNEVEREIHNWGDGLQHLIAMCYPLFLTGGEPLMLFVEEPELYLHPGYQRIFIDQVLSDADRRLQVFVATHSHQFLDITIDSSHCSVFKLSKTVEAAHADENDARVSITRVAGSDLELLADLGVRNSSVMLSNCTVWVEGITDRLYLRHYLNLYQSSRHAGRSPFLEDLHFSFVEYGGSNITHWSFLGDSGIRVDRLCSDLLLIADGDGPRKAERHQKLRESLKEKFVLLDVKEVENLIAPAVLKSTVDSLEAREVSWAEFDWESYRNEPLGTFLEHQLSVANHIRARRTPHPYADDYGAIKDKVRFCHAVIEQTRSFEDLSPSAQLLAARIFDFIEDHNR